MDLERAPCDPLLLSLGQHQNSVDVQADGNNSPSGQNLEISPAELKTPSNTTLISVPFSTTKDCDGKATLSGEPEADLGVSSNIKDAKKADISSSTTPGDGYSDVSSCSELENDNTFDPDQVTDSNEKKIEDPDISHCPLETDALSKPHNCETTLLDGETQEQKGELERNVLEDQYSNISSPEPEQESTISTDAEPCPISCDLNAVPKSAPSDESKVSEKGPQSGGKVHEIATETCSSPCNSERFDGNEEIGRCTRTADDYPMATDEVKEAIATSIPIPAPQESAISRSPHTETTDSGFHDGVKNNVDVCPSHCEDMMEHSSFDFLQTCLQISESGSTPDVNSLSTSKETDALVCEKPDQNLKDPNSAAQEPQEHNDQEVFDTADVSTMLDNSCNKATAKLNNEDNTESSSALKEKEDEIMEVEACLNENETNQPTNTICLTGPQTMKRRLDPVVLVKVNKDHSDQVNTYCCAHCEENFTDRDLLIAHFHLQHSSLSFQQCLTCRRYFTNDKVAENHSCSESWELSISPITEYQQSSKSSQPPATALFRCSSCPLRFRNVDSYEKHQLKHKRSSQFKGVTSAQTHMPQYKAKKQLSSLTSNKIPPLKRQSKPQCHKCGHIFYDISGLGRHLKYTRCTQSKHVKKKEKSKSGKTYIETSYGKFPSCSVKLVDINGTNLSNSNNCALCSKTFRLLAQYNIHMKTNSIDKPFKCKDCNKSFKYSWNLNRHTREQCDYKTSQGEQCAKVQMKKQGAEVLAPATSASSPTASASRYSCPLCPRLFKHSYNLLRHLRLQCLKEYTKTNGKARTDRGFKCPLCSMVYTMVSNLRRHLKKSCFQRYKNEEMHKLKRQIRGPSLDVKAKTERAFSSVKPSTNSKYLKCMLCPAVFLHASGLSKHKRKHRLYAKIGQPVRYRRADPSLLKGSSGQQQIQDEKMSDPVKSVSLSCRICGKDFIDTLSLKRHMHLHKENEPHSCQQCGKHFKHRSLMIAHAHTHKRNVQCSVCKKMLPSIAEFLKHRRVHDNKAKITCVHCPLEFQFPVWYLRHMKIHETKNKKDNSNQDKKEANPTEHLKKSGPFALKAEFNCRLCQKSFGSAKALGDHCVGHLPAGTSSKCQFCKRQFSNRQSLIRHMRLHTGEKPYPCKKCGKYFSRKENVLVHLEKCTVRVMVKVEQNTSKDDVTIKKEESRIVLHNVKKPHKCPQCPQAFLWNSSLTKHLNGHKLKLLTPCSKCERCFRKSVIEAHEKACNGKAPSSVTVFPCSKCGKTFSRICNKNVHAKKCTGNGIAEVGKKGSKGTGTGLTDRMPYKCTHCSRSFKHRSYLLKHLPSHKAEKPYACMYCGHQYGTQRRCLEHEAFCDGIYRRKSEPRPKDIKRENCDSSTKDGMEKTESTDQYPCKFCAKTFSKAKNLRRHILTHTDVKPYRCKTCDSCFSRHDYLKVHQSRCKGGIKRRPEVSLLKISLKHLGTGWQNAEQGKSFFQCTTCSKTFSSESNLKRHRSLSHTHGVKKPFECNSCGSSFTEKQALVRHKLKLRCKNAPQNHETKTGSAKATSQKSKEISKLQKKIPKHSSKNSDLTCTYCHRIFSGRGQLLVHTRLHTGEKPFGCENCGERFIRRDYLQRHLVRCTSKGEASESVPCNKCGNRFPQELLQDHKSTCSAKGGNTRSKTLSESKSSPKIKTFSCTKCSQKFLLFSQLQQHILSAHRQDRSPNLPITGADTVDSVNQQIIKARPEKTVAAEKSKRSHPCPFCNMMFLNRSGLGMHVRKHTTKHPNSCSRCGKGFWNKTVLKRHLRKCQGSVDDNNETTGYLEPLCEDKDSVLLFNTASSETGTGVLQTTFSCRDEENVQTDDADQKSSRDSNTDKGQIIKKKYQCSECDQSFADGLMLISHLENHGREDVLKGKGNCKICGRSFDTLQALSRHMSFVHDKQMPNACPLCMKTFRSASDLQIHKFLHDPNRPFPCSICTCRFMTERSLNIHIAQSHPKPKKSDYICQPCNKAYASLKSFRRHNRTHHKNGPDQDRDDSPADDSAVDAPVNDNSDASDDGKDGNGSDDDSDSAPYFPCHVCGKTFPTSEGLEDHQRCHLGEKPHECEECGKCFFQLVNLQQHQRSHKSEFQCQTCGRGFVSLFALKKHKHSHGKSRPYRCSKCNLSFAGPSQLAEHISTHRDENFPCDLCDLTFSCKSSRAEHRKIHEPEEELPPLVLPTVKPPVISTPIFQSQPPSSTAGGEHGPFRYRCIICSMRFRDSEQLSEHGCKASKDRPYSCPECDKHFLLGSHLKKHQLTHQLSGPYRYQCNQCHMNFTYRHHFLSHLRRHGTEKESSSSSGDQEGAPAVNLNPDNIYQCPICPKSYSQAMDLANHLTEHSFMCKLCSMTFPTKTQLTEHEQGHLTSTTQYECTECGETFFGSEAFKQHQCAKRRVSIENGPRPQLASTIPHKQSSKSSRRDEEEDVDVGEDFYICPTCKRRFSTEADLGDHHKKHPECRPYKCQVCGKRFAKQRYVNKHMATHGKAFQCSECPQAFYDEASLNKHTEIHQRNPFKCTTCQASYPTAQQLQRHEKKHAAPDQMTGGTHRCDMCYKSFGHISLLRKHQETHVGEVVYECTECDKAFAFFHLLEEHQRTHEGHSSAASDLANIEIHPL